MTVPGTDGATQRQVPRTAVLWQPTSTPSLAARGVAPPYVLAGHSSGAVYTQIFAGMYPNDVAGMVMLDAQPPRSTRSFPAGGRSTPCMTRGSTRAVAGSRSASPGSDTPSPPAGCHPRRKPNKEADLSTAEYYRALHDEIAQLRTSLTQAQQVTSFGDKPLIVVTAGKDAQDGWLPLQDKMVQLSSNSDHRVLPDVSHASLIEDQHDSRSPVPPSSMSSTRSAPALRSTLDHV